MCTNSQPGGSKQMGEEAYPEAAQCQQPPIREPLHPRRAVEAMNDSSTGLPLARSPLEEFLRDYAEVTGGVWDEVEPQVYDVLLPSSGGSEEALRVAFDPEAIPEHPGAQLASYGTPLIDR